MKSRNWGYILIYFVIATTLSGVFRLGVFDWYNNIVLPLGLTVFVKSMLEGVGPIAGATFVFAIINKKSDVVFLGTKKIKSYIMIFVPIFLFTIFGANNNQNLNRHYYGFIVGVSLVLYAIFEEFGWRGFLQNELTGINPLMKFTIIGVIWYLWHLSFISNNTTLFNELKFLGILVFASWGIGTIAEKTKSVFASACFHLIGSIVSFSPLMSNSFDDQTRYIIFAICLIAWILIVNTWDKTLLMQKEDIQS